MNYTHKQAKAIKENLIEQITKKAKKAGMKSLPEINSFSAGYMEGLLEKALLNDDWWKIHVSKAFLKDFEKSESNPKN